MNLHITENKMNNRSPITPVSLNNPRTAYHYKKLQIYMPDTIPYSQKSDTWFDCIEWKCIREKEKRKKAAVKMSLNTPGSRQIKLFIFLRNQETHFVSKHLQSYGRPSASTELYIKKYQTLGSKSEGKIHLREKHTFFFNGGTSSLFYCWTIPNLNPPENWVARNNGLRSRP